MGYARIRIEETPRYEGAPTTAPYRISTNVFYLPIMSGAIGPVPAHLDRSDEVRNNLSPMKKIIDGFAPNGSLRMRSYLNGMIPLLQLAGLTGTLTQGAGTNEVQTVAQGGTWTGGTFTLTFGTDTTAPIPFNATAAQVQAALEALPSIGVGGVRCTGGALPTTLVTVNFEGLLAATNVAALTGTATGLTGTTPTVTIATTVPGVVGAIVDPNGNGIPTGAWRAQFAKRTGATAKTADITLGYNDVGLFQQGQGYGVSQVSMAGNGEVSFDLLGLVSKPIDDPVLTPALDASTIQPLRSARMLLTWLTGGANVEGGSFTWSLQNPLNAARHHGLRSDYPALMEPGDGVPALTGSLNSRTFDRDELNALQAATSFAAKADYLGDSKIASTGAFYRMFLEMPSCQITGGQGDDLQNRNRHGANWNWEANYDDVAGYDFRITIIGGVTAMETYV